MSLNKVMLIGRLGKDPETNYTKNDLQITNITLATDRMIRQPGGGFGKETDWTRVVSFGKTAENIQKYLKKGSNCYVEGRLQTRQYTDQSGANRVITEVVASDVQFLDGKPQTQQERPKPQPRSQREPREQHSGWTDGGSIDDLPEDLPF